MGRGPRVERAAPERVDALERKHRLRDIGLGNQDGTGCAQGGDELMIINPSKNQRGQGEGGTNWCVLLGGLVGPLREPDCAIEALHVDFWAAFALAHRRAHRTEGGRRNALMSLTLIGTPCNGPLSSPVLANSTSSLRASSLASSKNTEQRRKREFDDKPNQASKNGGNRSRTLRQTIRCFLRLSSARQVGL